MIPIAAIKDHAANPCSGRTPSRTIRTGRSITVPKHNTKNDVTAASLFLPRIFPKIYHDE